MLYSSIQTTSVSSQINAMLEAVEQRSQQFVITTGKRRVAHLIPEALLRAMVRFIDLEKIEQRDPGLVDTIALMFNDEVRLEIEESVRQWKAGEVRHAEEFFNEVRTSNPQDI